MIWHPIKQRLLLLLTETEKSEIICVNKYENLEAALIITFIYLYIVRFIDTILDDKSWCYSSAEGKKASNKEFLEYGAKFERGDVVGAYLDMGEEMVTMIFTKNGETQVHFTIKNLVNCFQQ